MPKLLKKWFSGAKAKGSSLFGSKRRSGSGFSDERTGSFGKEPSKLRDFGFDLRKIDLKSLSKHSGWFRWGLLVLSLFLLSDLVARTLGLLIPPVPSPTSRNRFSNTRNALPVEDYDSIVRRNIFDVTGKIPPKWDEGMLDCLSQARPSTQRMSLLGTIVVSDDKLSTALVQDDSGANKMAVRKNDLFFDGKYQALEIERKKICFKVISTNDLEFIEIPDDNAAMGTSTLASSEGIVPVSDGEFKVKQDFLSKNLNNLNEILQTARAIPYNDPTTGRMKGFLIQTIDPTSLFAQLGLRTGDLLEGVNDISLDNAGKGLEAFQKLRTSSKIVLRVTRGGAPTTLTYDVQ